MEPLFSIIVPVYNVENYLRACVDSILSQSFQEFELILVDDGSPDKCPAICDEYARIDHRIRVIHKINGGPSDARNAGLQLARGVYVLFVDSDDYIGPESLKRLAETLSQRGREVDVMFLDAIKVFPNGAMIPLGDGFQAAAINGQSKEAVMRHLAGLPKYPGSAWTKLVRRGLIEDAGLRFEKGLLSEDLDWTAAVLCAADSFAYCDTPYYYYRQCRAGSITNTVSERNVRDLVYIIGKWASQNLESPYQKEINAFMAYEYMITLLYYAGLDKTGRTHIARELKQYSWVLSYAKARKAKLTAVCCRIFGIGITAKLLKMVYKAQNRGRR